MKILLTGFEPFAEYSTNSSWEAIRRFSQQKIQTHVIKSILLPVEYAKSVEKLLTVIFSYDPDIVISFGLAEDSFIKLERQAKNDVGQLKDNVGCTPQGQYIINNGPAKLKSRLPLDKIYDKLLANNIEVKYSLDAGSYVCNYVFYNELFYCDKARNLEAIGFIHFPPVSNKYDQYKLEQIVGLILDAVVE